jgi:hypothetical protein
VARIENAHLALKLQACEKKKKKETTANKGHHFSIMLKIKDSNFKS